MNRILFEERRERYKLDARDARFEHVRGVLRMGVGDVFDVGVINGPVGRARVVGLEIDGLEVEVEWGEEPPALPEVELFIGLPRPQTAKKILFEATVMGVRRIVFFEADRSDPAYAKSSLWRDEEWRRHLVLGAEQAFDTRIPEVEFVAKAAAESRFVTKAATLGEGAATLEGKEGVGREAGVDLVLDVYEGAVALGEAVPVEGLVRLWIGPERGWTTREREWMREQQFTLVTMGKRVLRVETAVLAGLSILHHRQGRLG